MNNSQVNILIAGGGTGGHLFPGIAIAQTFLKRDLNNRILFAGTDRPFEKTALRKAGFNHFIVNAAGIKGLGLWRKIKSALKIPGAVIACALMIQKFNPRIIIGVGGYSSGPVALAAWLLRRKVVLHEQNILPGITNKILARFASRVYLSFSETTGHFNPKKVQVTGNPVRQEILDLKEVLANRDNTQSGKPFTVLVAGGSQGAHSINMAVCDAIDLLKKDSRYHFIHQTGKKDEQEVKKRYLECGISCLSQAFFDDMEKQYKEADLIICRAGATTIAEITAMGHSSIMVPFPHAADNHQLKNAMALVKTGAAEMMTEDVLNGQLLAKRIEFFENHRNELKKISERSGVYGRPDAADVIVNDCYTLLGMNTNDISPDKGK